MMSKYLFCIIPLGLLLTGCRETHEANLNALASTDSTPSPTPNTTDDVTTAAAPLPGSIYPFYGSTLGGTDVTITGTGFASDSTVLFYPNGVATSYPCAISTLTPPTSTSIVCQTQAQPWGKNTVTVVNSDGQTGSIINGFTFVADPPSLIRFGPVTQCATPIPTWTACPNCAVDPASGTYGGGTSVTLKGLNFLSGATITIGSKECTSPSFSLATCPQTITCTTQAQSPGTVDVVVTNPDGQITSIGGGYQFTVPAPSGLSYSTNPALYPLSFPIPANSPTLTTGVASSYSISPTPLPSGLSFNTTTGVISGTPSSISATSTYTVTANNSGGSNTVSLKLGTRDFGNGTNGTFLATSSGQVVNNYTYLTADAAASTAILSVNSLSGSVVNGFPFAAGDRVFIVQVRGATTAASFWEFNTIQSVDSSTTPPTITLLNALQQSYKSGTSGSTQIVRVPQYVNVTIPIGTSITAPAWDGNVGGIVAFLATGTVTVEGIINADGIGFRGGAGINSGTAYRGESFTGTYPTASASELNGGGGGANSGGGKSHGGGGGYSTAGNSGSGTGPGAGGSTFGINTLDNLLFGAGGGGSGSTSCGGVSDIPAPGSAGGGIIFFAAPRVQVSSPGKITANGADAINSTCDSGAYGGAGAGGSLYITASTINILSGTVTAIGGASGVGGSVGQGGDGRIRLFSNSTSGTTSPFPYGSGAP